MSAIHNAYPPALSIGRPLVSIIVPYLNAAPYITDCIRSVLGQSWDHWELLLVDNGSTDGSRNIAAAFSDPRIHLMSQPKSGVSNARNMGLAQMKGQYFCFLDADDLLPKDAIRLRLDLFRRYPEACFADGAMEAFNTETGKVKWTRSPWYYGIPFDALMRVDGSCFAGNTWMVRRLPGHEYRMPEHMDHSEDNAFYLGLSRQGLYVSTPRVVLHYRTGHISANSDPLSGHPGYLDLYKWMKQLQPPPSEKQMEHAWKKLRRFMFRDLLKRGYFMKAFHARYRPRPI
ncbi:MAG: glycosyltransferase [Flavobacteriales bacterium]|jgi:glycosyltransferase involved in cell wall biosynthesis|nr:glycosyltransferase [Flavobacteriales bacterium]MCB0758186.1 glycosyltransferase family 2 protein [Flavobacteriales bacterium]